MSRRLVFAAVLCTLFWRGGFAFAEVAIPENVAKVLSDNCLKCHGEKKTSGKLDLRTFDAMLTGGKRGAAVVPSLAAESRLVQLIKPDAKPHMPPGKKQLSDEEIAILSTWVDGLAAIEVTKTADESDPSEANDEGWRDENNVEEESTKENAAWAPPPSADPTAVIDMLVSAGYASHNVVPNRLCGDRSFARRVYFDLAGRIPTVTELHDFLAQTDSAKREKLVDHLLASDDFSKHFASCFDTMLLGRNERKLDERRGKGWHNYLEAVFQNDRPWNQVAREVLLARADSDTDRAKQRGHMWFLFEHDNKHQQIAETVSRGFFGVDIQCAQCHDHPMADEIKQSHYWGLVAFFKRSKNENSKNGIAVGESAIGGFDSYANAFSGDSEQAVLTFLHAATVEEDRPDDPTKQEEKDEFYVPVENEPRVPRFSRREKFVDEVLDGHPLLQRAYANRVWALLIGRGFVHPIDEMDSKHPVSHPALLKWLAQDFAQHDYRTKRLVKSIVLSRAYQLDSRRPDSDPELSTFAYGLEKPLSAEVMSRSLKTAFDLKDVDVATLEKELRKLFPDVVAKNQMSDLKQTLLLSNHPKMLQLVESAAGQLMDGNEPINDAFERLFARMPSPEERSAIGAYFEAHPEDPETTMTHVLWALVTSAEFRFNH